MTGYNDSYNSPEDVVAATTSINIILMAFLSAPFAKKQVALSPEETTVISAFIALPPAESRSVNMHKLLNITQKINDKCNADTLLKLEDKGYIKVLYENNNTNIQLTRATALLLSVFLSLVEEITSIKLELDTLKLVSNLLGNNANKETTDEEEEELKDLGFTVFN